MDKEATPPLPEPDNQTAANPTPNILIDGQTYAFPGCRTRRIRRNEIGDYDHRVEFWDADTETAFEVREPTTPYHESPTMRLAGLAERIAATRGAGIVVLGASDLLLRDRHGNRHRILQADQIVYTGPTPKLPTGAAVEVEAGELPDVVLEVDVTTDVRRGKLALYEKWGFPEIWVEVPKRRAPSRPNRTPGLTIHLRTRHGYVQSPTSAAFPTWSAAEIHTALNEAEGAMSPATAAALRRVGKLMRQATGTGPDDDPFLQAERAEARLEARVEALTATFHHRGLPLSPTTATQAAKSPTPLTTLLQTAQTCQHEKDFLTRILM